MRKYISKKTLIIFSVILLCIAGFMVKLSFDKYIEYHLDRELDKSVTTAQSADDFSNGQVYKADVTNYDYFKTYTYKESYYKNGIERTRNVDYEVYYAEILGKPFFVYVEDGDFESLIKEGDNS